MQDAAPFDGGKQKLRTALLVLDNVSVLGRDKWYYVNIALRLREFLRAKPKETPEGGGLYFTIYPKLSPNMGSISFLKNQLANDSHIYFIDN